MTAGAPPARLVRRRSVLDFTAGAPALPARATASSVVLGALARPVRSVHCVDLTPGEAVVVALTWDDGPHPDHTPRVLDELAAAGVRATFFVLVGAAEANPGVLERMVAEGHEVGLHGTDHRRLSALPPRRAARVVSDGRRRLEQLTGSPVTLFRPPYGAQSPGQVLLTRATGLQSVIWSAWATDWVEDEEQAIAERALAAVHPGAVVLLHDAYGEALLEGGAPGPHFARHEVARAVLAGLARRGITAVPVGELMRGRRAVTTVWVERARRTGAAA